MANPGVVRLAEAAGLPVALLGGKAAPLARLAAAGFPVPSGLVVTTAAWQLPADQLATAITVALPELDERGAGLAVRSSAVAEDTRDASYAGQYETYLNVPLGDVVEAVQRCWQAATAARVQAYRSNLGSDVEGGVAADTGAHAEAGAGADVRSGEAVPAMAVLIQPMVAAAAAGVAFTANPLTGDRAEIVVTAVRGLGERLVSGLTDGDEWVVRGTAASPRRVVEQAITAAQALAVAALAASVQHVMQDVPQDIEWAIEACDGPSGGERGRLVLLQARPMTALPDPSSWTPPGSGLWMRNFRLGEWLPDPMTPLFADWLLPLLEDGYLAGMRDSIGVRVPFPYAQVNGWYYNTTPRPNPRLLLHALASSRGRIVPVLYQVLFNVSRNPAAADRLVLDRLHHQWLDHELPTYRQLVDRVTQQLARATPDRAQRLVDEVGLAAGRQLWFLAVLGGSAWKMEGCLTRFADRHLAGLTKAGGPLADGVQVLLRGLDDVDTSAPRHAVASIDWYWPTLGETDPAPQQKLDPARRAA
ncbi:MAG: hypothetical protein EOP01_00100, partial [Propionibacteriaceae bacterium]